jgi:opacity protein-like surface antigen
MSAMHPGQSHLTAILLVVSFAHAPVAAGQDATPSRSSQAQARAAAAGFDLLGTVAMNWPAARESFEAAALDSRPVEFGGGVQSTNVWRNLFVQINASRWSDTGERVFIDANGDRFPLGIPLDVKATFLDVSAGWEFGVRRPRARPRLLPYLGAGMGAVFYKEESPFAEPGDDVDERVASYHVLAGVEVRLVDWLGLALDGRYRYVPDLLGEGGISAVLGDDQFGGFQASVGVRVGFRKAAPPPTPPELPPGQQTPEGIPAGVPPPRRASEARLAEAAPAFLQPDSSRTPLRVLERGTRVLVLEERGEWVLVEFDDPQYGPRRGFVLRKYVQVP